MDVQTSPEIPFLGSLEDSIFYSIARFFLSETGIVLTEHNVDLYTIEAHATLPWIPIWCPMLQLVEHSSIEQTWPLGSDVQDPFRTHFNLTTRFELGDLENRTRQSIFIAIPRSFAKARVGVYTFLPRFFFCLLLRSSMG